MKYRIAALFFLVGSLQSQTKVAHDQVRAPKVTVLMCAGAISPTSKCDGLYYVGVVTPGGTELKIVGTLAATEPSGENWSVVP